MSLLSAITSQTFTVSTTNDSLKESDETFKANLSNPSNATIDDSQSIATITDNDATGMTNTGDHVLSPGNEMHFGDLAAG